MTSRSEAMRTLYLDLETYPREGIDAFLPDPGDAPANYKDPVKIRAYQDEQRQGLKARAALDPDLAQIVALGWAFDDDLVSVESALLTSEQAMVMRAFACIEQADRIIGFNLPGFDMRVLSRRALLLGVDYARMELGRYRYDHRLLDVQAWLSWGDGPQKGKSLDWYCRLFGVTEGSEDTMVGADIAGLVQAGEWSAIEQHVRCDVQRVRALAQRVGVVRGRQMASVTR